MAGITEGMAIVGSATLAFAIVQGLPKVVNEYQALFSVLKNELTNKVTMVIEEFDGHVKNEIYEAVEIYLGNKLFSNNQKIFKVSKTDKEKNLIEVALEHNEKVKDFYDGHKFKWVWLEFKCFDHPRDFNSIERSDEGKSFKLTFRKEDRDFVLHYYLPYIIKEAKFLTR